MPILAARAHAWFLDDIHESNHKEVILQCADPRLRQYRLLPTDGTSDRDAVWWDVILEATLAERVETREDLGRGVALETDAAAQEVVVVLLPHSGRGAVGHAVVDAVETAAGRYGDLKRKQISMVRHCVTCLHRQHVEGKGMFYIVQYPLSNPIDLSKRFTLCPAGRPVHSDTNSTSLGSILATQQLRAMTKSLTFPPLYSFIQVSELGRHGENENAQTLKR